jgi:hypothetical protein
MLENGSSSKIKYTHGREPTSGAHELIASLQKAQNIRLLPELSDVEL